MTRTVSEEKKALRRQVKERVAQLPKDYCQKSDAAIRQYVLSLPEYGQARRIFCYAGTPSEIQTLPLIAQMLSDGKEVGVPYCISLGKMEVRQIRSLSDLKPGRYGILAPDTKKASVWAMAEVSMISIFMTAISPGLSYAVIR